MTTKAKDGRETLQERLRARINKHIDPRGNVCVGQYNHWDSALDLDAIRDLDAAQAEIASLEDKISDIEGVWPDWASKLLDIVYPRECRAAEDEFDLPEDLKEWLAQHEQQVRKAANRPAPLPVAEDVVEKIKKDLRYQNARLRGDINEEGLLTVIRLLKAAFLLRQPEEASLLYKIWKKLGQPESASVRGEPRDLAEFDPVPADSLWQPEAAPEGWREAIELIAQYRSDLKYPVAKDSRDRRIERIDAFLAKFGGSQ